MWDSEGGSNLWGQGNWDRTGRAKLPLSCVKFPKACWGKVSLWLSFTARVASDAILRKMENPCWFRKRAMSSFVKITALSSTPSLFCLSHLITRCALIIPGGWLWHHFLSLQHWVTLSLTLVIVSFSEHIKEAFFCDYHGIWSKRGRIQSGKGISSASVKIIIISSIRNHYILLYIFVGEREDKEKLDNRNQNTK